MKIQAAEKTFKSQQTRPGSDPLRLTFYCVVEDGNGLPAMAPSPTSGSSFQAESIPSASGLFPKFPNQPRERIRLWRLAGFREYSLKEI
jgi:hypothetical protein